MGITKNLVLGGSGTIGKALCQYLDSIGQEVVNLDLKEGFDLRDRDMNDYAGMDYVWFLAWDVGGSKYLSSKDNQLDIIRNNTLICENVFSFLQRTKIPFMFASSQLAAVDNTYGITKILGEQWSKLLGGKVVKFWNVYGWEEPGEKSHVIPDLVTSGLTSGKIQLLTNGEEERQFIYMDDCVRNLVRIRDGAENDVHLTNGHWIKIKDLAASIAKATNASLELGEVKGYNNRVDPDPNHVQYDFPTSLTDGIEIIKGKATEFLQATGKLV